MKKYTLSLILVVLANLSFADENSWKIIKLTEEVHKNVPFRMPKETNIVFSNGKTLKTAIIEFKLLATIITNENIPFLIFSGRDCTECDMRTSIYIHSPLISDFSGDTRYSYPGNLFYYEDDSLLEKSRMFYGQCTKQTKKSIIWYSDYLGDDNKWHKINYLVDFKGNNSNMTEQVYTKKTFNKTLELVKNGICFEIKGIDRTSEP